MKEALDAPPTRRTGRPLSFERDAALHQAMLVFWQHGYEATSISDLTAAMGITAPSIYTAFGNKKELFLQAVDRYMGLPATPDAIMDAAPTAREAALNLMKEAAVTFTNPKTPRGCLLASSTVACSAEAADVSAALSKIRLGIEASLCRRISHAKRRGELSRAVDAKALAAMVIAVIQGMSTLARDGASRQKLFSIARTAMLSWPHPESLGA